MPVTTLVLFNKPYNVLSQFSSADGRACLADFLRIPGIYPAGRLDRDSEGLLLLTDDGKAQAYIADPRYKLPKTYWAQVEGVVSPQALSALKAGIMLKDGRTLPAQAKAIAEPTLWPRHPPIRTRLHIPTSWVELTIREGRNRQVRRMLAAAGYPVLRLIRASIGQWRLDGLLPGEYRRETIEIPALTVVPPKAQPKYRDLTKRRPRRKSSRPPSKP